MIDVIIGFAVGLFLGTMLGVIVLALLINNADLPDVSDLEDKKK